MFKSNVPLHLAKILNNVDTLHSFQYQRAVLWLISVAVVQRSQVIPSLINLKY